MSIIFTPKKATLSHSSYVHYFNVIDVPVALVKEAVEALYESGYSGLSIQLNGDQAHSIKYVTNIEWEARKEYAEQLASDISQVFKNFDLT